MSFTAKDVQALRQATGAGMMDAKRALEASDGDAEVAAQWLREKGLAKAAERSDRANTQGAVAVFVDGTVGSIVQLKCETDFVASSERFRNLVSELAALVALKGTGAAAERTKEIEDLRLTLKEHIELGEVVRIEGEGGSLIGSYLHVQGGRGVNAVLVELAGGSDQLAHDVAVHVAFAASEVPDPGGRAIRPRREGAGHAGGHHPQRGQAGAGDRSDRGGSAHWVLQGDLPAGAAVRQGRQDVDQPAPRRSIDRALCPGRDRLSRSR